MSGRFQLPLSSKWARPAPNRCWPDHFGNLARSLDPRQITVPPMPDEIGVTWLLNQLQALGMPFDEANPRALGDALIARAGGTVRRDETFIEAERRLKEAFEACKTYRPLAPADRGDRFEGGLSADVLRRAWYPGPRTEGLWGARWRALDQQVQRGRMTTSDLEELDQASTCVVGMLPSPSDERACVRGLVVGDVQSGKTNHMTSVAAKAVDAGYNVVIILAGVTDALRTQTQRRVNKDLFVYCHGDPLSANKLRDCHPWSRLPQDDEPSAAGEVKIDPNSAEHQLSGGAWVLAITKKNKSTIDKLTRTLGKVNPDVRAKARVLVIDDEADSASPHAPKHPDADPMGINKAIRGLLARFPHHCYLGYTATPYAVLLANPDDDEGFYPRDFVVALPQSPAYFGMARIFGAADDPGSDGGLAWTQVDVDSEQMRLFRGGEVQLTEGLRDAMRYFLCATAARAVRGQADASSSMLVHLSHKRSDHAAQVRVVDGELGRIRTAVVANCKTELAALRQVWTREMDRLGSWRDGQREPVCFDALEPHLHSVVRSCRACKENSDTPQDAKLRYYDDMGNPVREIAIAVGGNVLSRGLTIEGLVVSFFGRRIELYDALSQAGRWFGYRSGYADMQRIWSTEPTFGFFRDLALVDRDVREQIVELCRQGVSPRQLPVSVRKHDLLEITSRYKLWFAEEVDLPVQDTFFETRSFWRGKSPEGRQNVSRQWEAADDLVRMAGTAAGWGISRADTRSPVARDIDCEAVFRFLRSYDLHPSDPLDKLRGPLLEFYNKELSMNGIYSRWNIAIIDVSGEAGTARHRFADGPEVGKHGRSPRTMSRGNQSWGSEAALLKQLSSPRDVGVDFDSPLQPGARRSALLHARGVAGGPGRPLLALYVIDSKSTPRSEEARKKGYGELDAPRDLVGYMLVNPTSPVVADGRLSGRVRVRPTAEGEPPDLDIDAPTIVARGQDA